MSFEDTFRDDVPGLEISDEEAEGIATVEDAVTFLRGRAPRTTDGQRPAA